VLLILSSDEFDFTDAEVVLVSQGNPGVVARANCHENVTSELNISSGTYNLWLSAMIVGTRSGKVVRLHGSLPPWTVEVTTEDIDRGRMTVVAPQGGIFKITVVDNRHVPVPYYQLLAAVEENTIELQMDENGTQLLFGNPTGYFIQVDKGLGIVIDHVDLQAG
jgi:hypothetical protein